MYAHTTFAPLGQLPPVGGGSGVSWRARADARAVAELGSSGMRRTPHRYKHPS